MLKGRVEWFNKAKGFGFISRQGGDDLFVHRSSISGEDFKNLEENEVVDFEVAPGKKGEQAVNVRRAN